MHPDTQDGACPMAEAIRDRNAKLPITFQGRHGFEQMMANNAPTVRNHKRRAAEAILALRRARVACKRLGRNWRVSDARWLARAQADRRAAAAMLARCSSAAFAQAAE